jgi:hypothetical protein
VSFAGITLCVASQRVFIIVVYFVIDSVRKLFDTASYNGTQKKEMKTHYCREPDCTGCRFESTVGDGTMILK